MDDVALNSGNVLILGDLNSDCDYYNNEVEKEFDEWHWVINDKEDTTSGESNCAYDRIIASNELKEKVIRHGIEKNTEKEHSDHYLIWVEVK